MPAENMLPRIRVAAVIAAAFLVSFLILPGWAADPAFPQLTGRVVDAAGIIPGDARERIEAALKAYEDKTSDQIVVATVPTLGDLTIEEYANRLFRSWGIGQKGKNNGALLLVAPKERKLRIETGYGAEGALTDAVSSTIINTVIAPRFKSGDFAGGIERGVAQMVAILGGDAATEGRTGKGASLAAAPDNVNLVSDIIPAIFVIIIVIIILRSSSTGGARYHRTRSGNWIVYPSVVAGGWSGGGSQSGSWGGGGLSGGGFSGGGFSGGGGSSGGGGASGSW